MQKTIFKKTITMLLAMIMLLSIAVFSASAEGGNTVATVSVQGVGTREFDSFEKGWVYALQQSLDYPVTMKLCADWIAPDGNFYCEDEDGDEYGTKNGYLYLYYNYLDLTIDLNGHKIDRNLKNAKSNGQVFYMSDEDIKLTIKDSAGGGKITGGNNTGDGGAFYVYDGSLYIEGGEISGNHAENGGGIYWFSDNNLCMTGGKITENIAKENGGGIYNYSDGSFGGGADNVYFGGDAQIYGNLANDNKNNNVYLYGGRVVNRTAGQKAGIPNVLLADKAMIGISTDDTVSPISGPNSCFNWGDDICFFSDNDAYYIKMVYNAASGNHACRMHIDSVANRPAPVDPVMSVTFEDGVTVGFADFGKGWAYALKQSLLKPATITLLADWVAENGSFYCTYDDTGEYGSNNGYLYINDDHILTIDLNGHKIDRNLKEATDDGVVFWLYDYDAKLTIKDSVGGGKITGGNNTGNGGAFFVERGSLYMEGGEITGNKAKNGGGIYWESRDILCLTGGKITRNIADEDGPGVYATDWGDIYLGGTIVIAGNTSVFERNFYLADEDVDVNNAAGQDGVPNKPLTNGASIGVYSSVSDDIISGDDSRFAQGDYKYFFTEGAGSGLSIRAVYDANGGNHAHKIYINSEDSADLKNPKINNVDIKDETMISIFYFDLTAQVLTLVGHPNKKDSFKQVALDSLIDYDLNEDATHIDGAAALRDLTSPSEYKVMSSNGTYNLYTVIVKWDCFRHKDADGDCLCDYCDEYVLIDFAITNYNAESKDATVKIPEAGKYILVFADYENGKLENADIVTFDFQEGINVVPQNTTTFTLGKGDKIMLWRDTTTCAPLCQYYTIK